MGLFTEMLDMSFSRRNQELSTNSNDKKIFQEVFGYARDRATPEDALQIPIVNACISRISDVIATTKLHMYKRTEKGIEKVENDDRVKLLNSEVDGGHLNTFELKKVIVRDYFLKGACYFYIKRKGNDINDIAYLKHVSISSNEDEINKIYEIHTSTNKKLRPHELFRITRNSHNGITGKSIIDEAGLQFLLIVQTMERLLKDVKRGFLPKGFFKLERNVRDLEQLESAIKKALGDDNLGYMIFNEGVNFEPLEKKKDAEKEAKANSMEINRIAAMFGVPVSIINGNGTDVDKFNFINFTILPLLTTIEASLNRDFLLEKEKGEYYFAFDTKELLKGNVYERFKSYEIAIKNNIMSMDEVRDLENMPRLNLNFYKFNIADAMYYYIPEKGINMLINVNTNTAIDINRLLAGENGIITLDDKEMSELHESLEEDSKENEKKELES